MDLPVSGETIHHPDHCCVCALALDPAGAKAWTAVYVLDLTDGTSALPGLQLTHTKHLYTEIRCACAHVTRADRGVAIRKTNGRWPCPSDTGPMLASLIVCLTQRLRCSRRLTQGFLSDSFGVYLCTSTINQCVHEAGRAIAPMEDQLTAEINAADLVHGDETTWEEAGPLLWLWVFCSSTVTLYRVGYRTKEIIENLLGSEFAGWLMSDGYVIYRDYLRSLRCWAHLVRKAKGLQEIMDRTHAQPFGNAALGLLEELMAAVYQAREGPPTHLQPLYSEPQQRFKVLCEGCQDCPHNKARALTRECLNDWDAIWVVQQFPWLPLTHNEAARALRHWVIARLISHGTRTEEGALAFGLLASVIETCRKRGISPWSYLAQRGKGNPAFPLPGSAAT
jgi:transposase